ncbi:REGULATOR OF CHROMOSOME CONDENSATION [Salix purpurea]|uniref:REGULATOR OF CHROMOSOME CONDENSATION n=1 Tax=Salix purpurea TaxID=77065 RepID=A0A9Q1AKA6_SALPP|nr:REGULATOR OF CHROMOSOME CONDENSATION [Salix purpurea]
MADLVSYGNADRDIEQALIALKKGSQLLKYGRKGKPKFCPFRLSNDEKTLIWISSGGERSLKLALISKIIPGQRTAVFQRYLRPEKDYLSFSLIYNNGKRSLDLICKDKVEAEVWIAGLKALISSSQGGRSKIDGWSDGGLYLDDGKDLTSNSASDSSVSISRDISSPEIPASFNPNTSPKNFQPESSLHSDRSHVASENTNMQVKGSGSDAFRVSVSSAPSTSSHGSAPDDCDALGDVYMWGEVVCSVKVGADKNISYLSTRADVLLPRPLESNVVLDVHHIACGVRHAAMVTRQGEVFTWGEESGGRLGHGVGKDVTQPCLVESLAATTVDFVACGEFHSCAVTMAGEIYTWGDGTHNAGLLGHGTDVSHWIPKRISGPLEGLQVASVTCGPWHTALVTSTGQLFTFGDGTFGVLGHGNRENVAYPREVESLAGLRIIAVACGVWHTAAVVEVIVTQSSSSALSGKLFTWGDGDKNRLGHGDKEPRLKPTCVPALIDYNFHKIACGHSLTVGLTTSGHVFTMGSTVYGQLGNPYADGKVPCLVEDKLSGECVEEIACGAYHVAALTSRNEVYTWGKGANGRLGHGDGEDRKTPTLYASINGYLVLSSPSVRPADRLLDLLVKGITAIIVDLFTAIHANPSNTNRRNAGPRLSGENKDRLDKADLRLSKAALPSNLDLIKQLDSKAAKQGKKADAFSLVRSSQAPSLLLLKDVVLSSAIDLRPKVSKPVLMPSGVSSRSVSPFSRRPSPPRSATPVPTMSGLSFSKSIADSLKKTNDLLNQEVLKLRTQVDSLRKRCEFQELELQRSAKKVQEAMAVSAEESAKSKAAKDVIKSLTAQLKDMAERLPPGVYDTESMKLSYPPKCDSTSINGTLGFAQSFRDSPGTNGKDDHLTARLSIGGGGVQPSSNSMSEVIDGKEPWSPQDGDNGMKSRDSSLVANGNNQVEAEWIEQDEPGVYITLVALHDGTRDLKRVRFSRRRFGEHQAETWWSENREKVYERYNVKGSDKSSVTGQAARRSEGGMSSSSIP